LRALKSALLVAALAGSCIWLYIKLFPSDEAVIRKNLEALAAIASIKPDDSTLARYAKTEKLREFFAEDVEINVQGFGREPQTISGRAELMQMAALARTSLQSARFQLLDVNVAVASPKDQATASMTLLGDMNGEKNAVAQELKMGFKKTDGAWLISRIETVQTLR
jgi:ketosteroid isomerase-like protein